MTERLGWGCIAKLIGIQEGNDGNDKGREREL